MTGQHRDRRERQRKGKHLGHIEVLKGLSRVVQALQMALLASAWQPPWQQNVGGVIGGEGVVVLGWREACTCIWLRN